MSDKIESLTPEQEAHLLNYRDEWLAIGRSCEPSDRAEATRIWKKMYSLLSMSEPEILWFKGPASAAIFRTLVAENKLEDMMAIYLLEQKLGYRLEAKYATVTQKKSVAKGGTDLETWGALVECSMEAVLDDPDLPKVTAKTAKEYKAECAKKFDILKRIQENIHKHLNFGFSGSHDAAWPAYYLWPHIAIKPIHTDDQMEKLNLWADLAKATGWWQPFEGVVVACERPSKQDVNEEGQLHCEDGPAVVMRDGWKVWSLNGITVDEQIVMHPETQAVDQIDAEENMDVRQIRIDRFSWERYLRESGAECIDHRKNEIEATMEALYKTKKDEVRLVATCATGRIFAMGVPDTIKTCQEAQEWLNGGKKIKIVGRT